MRLKGHEHDGREMARNDVRPLGRGYAPRGLRRPDAAWYVGVSPSKFDDWVRRGIMPGPKVIDRVVIWDRLALDAAFDALPDQVEPELPGPYDDFGL